MLQSLAQIRPQSAKGDQLRHYSMEFGHLIGKLGAGSMDDSCVESYLLLFLFSNGTRPYGSFLMSWILI